MSLFSPRNIWYFTLQRNKSTGKTNITTHTVEQSTWIRCIFQRWPRQVSLIYGTTDRGTAEPAEPAEPNKNHLFWPKYLLFYRIFNNDVSKQLSLVINLWINSWIKPYFRCHNLWRTGIRPYLTYLRPRRFSFLGWDIYTPSRLSNHVRCYHVASKTTAN